VACGSVVLMHYATSRKVAYLRPDEARRPGVDSVSNRNQYQKQENVSGEQSAAAA
jgi:hypothetical protein